MIKIESLGSDRHTSELSGTNKELLIEFSMIASTLVATFIESGATKEQATQDLSFALAVGISNYNEAVDVTNVKGGDTE